MSDDDPSIPAALVSPRRRWGPRRGDDERIARHLRRQAGADPGTVVLADGRVVRVGADAIGEGGGV